MKRLFFVSLILAVLGCNGAAKEQELQQQKLLTELAKTNTETLAAIEKEQAELTKRKGEIKAREMAVQAAFDSIKGREESLRKQESDANQREAEFAKNVANEDAKIRKEREALQLVNSALQAKQAELDRLVARYKEWEAALAKARQDEEAYRKSAEAKRVENRKADLKSLVNLTTDLFMKVGPQLLQTRSQINKQAAAMLAPENFAKIEGEDEFAQQARIRAEIFIEHDFRGWGNSLPPEIDAKIKAEVQPALRKWEEGYLKKAEPKPAGESSFFGGCGKTKGESWKSFSERPQRNR